MVRNRNWYNFSLIFARKPSSNTLFHFQINIIRDDRPTLGEYAAIVLKSCIIYSVLPIRSSIELLSILLEDGSIRSAISSLFFSRHQRFWNPGWIGWQLVGIGSTSTRIFHLKSYLPWGFCFRFTYSLSLDILHILIARNWALIFHHHHHQVPSSQRILETIFRNVSRFSAG